MICFRIKLVKGAGLSPRDVRRKGEEVSGQRRKGTEPGKTGMIGSPSY